jgi:DNA-binding HxlR family transcriptional regulator
MPATWSDGLVVTRTHPEVSNAPEGAQPAWTRETAADGIEAALAIIAGRWKLRILFQLFGGRRQRFSELERALAGVSQKVLNQQLRQLEQDGIVRRVAYAESPPRVEYSLTTWGQSLCPALDALLQWSSAREVTAPADNA